MIYYRLQPGRGDSQCPWQEGETWQGFGNREQPQGSEIQGNFLLPPEAAQGPSSCWVGRLQVGSLQVGKAIEHWEGEPVARGHWGLPDQLTPSLSSGTNGSPVLAQSLSTALAVPPSPGLGDKNQRNHRRTLSITPPLRQGQPSSAPSQGWGLHKEAP